MKPVVFVTQMPSRRSTPEDQGRGVLQGVWVPTVDLSPATEFGEIRVMLPPGMNFHASVPVIQQLREALLDFRADIDYFLPMGDPLVMAAGAAIIARRESSFKMLKWDRFTKCYHCYEVKL